MSKPWISLKGPALLAGLLLSTCVQAWDAGEVIRGLAKDSADAARFTEIKHLQSLDTPLRLKGVVRFMPPAGVEKHITSPYEERMTVSEGRLRLERGDKVRELALERHPVARAFVTAFTATLAGDIDTLREHYHLGLEGSERAWQLNLTPKDDALADKVSRIVVTGSGGTLQSFETRQPDGDRAIMHFSTLADDPDGEAGDGRQIDPAVEGPS